MKQIDNSQLMSFLIPGLELAKQQIQDQIDQIKEALNPREEPKEKKKEPSNNKVKVQPSFMKSDHHPFGCEYGCKLFYSKRGSRDKHHQRAHKAQVNANNKNEQSAV